MIVFEHVYFRHGNRPVLRDLTFSVGAGEMVALVGRSGAGKSTVLKLINRMLEPQEGRVLVEGRDTREWQSTALRRQTGYVLQEIGLFPHMDVAAIRARPFSSPPGAAADRGPPPELAGFGSCAAAGISASLAGPLFRRTAAAVVWPARWRRSACGADG